MLPMKKFKLQANFNSRPYTRTWKKTRQIINIQKKIINVEKE